jgi:hypothetical protein
MSITSTGVNRSTQMILLKKVEGVFKGKDAVDWMIANVGVDNRPQATEIGTQVLLCVM